MKKHIVMITVMLALFLLGKSMAAGQPEGANLSLKWEKQLTGTFESLRGVCAVSPTVVWASGSHGTVLRTLDGGINWNLRPIPGAEVLDFRDIHAFDAETALVISAGSPAKIFRTTDGGKTWRETYHKNHQNIFFDAMAFWDRNNGMAIADPIDGSFVVITTTDGGITWKAIPSANLPAPMPGEAAFAASGTCLTVQGTANAWFCTGGTQTRVFRTTDQGKTWRASTIPIRCGKDSQGAFSIAFKDARNGIVLGGDYKEESEKEQNAALSTDGGVTWKAVTTHPPTGFRECVAYIPALKNAALVAVGPSGSDLSRDGGATWKNFSPSGFHSFSAAPGTTLGWATLGWAVGIKGEISKLIRE